jgi:hypothetical protein
MVQVMSIHLNLYLHYYVEVNNYQPMMDLTSVNDCFQINVDIHSMHHFHFHHYRLLLSVQL